MTTLTIWREDAPETTLLQTTDGAEIAAALAGIDVRFERWTAAAQLPDGADQDEVLAAYTDEVARLQEEGGYRTTDVIRLPRGTPDTEPMRRKFLSEHTHSEDEVRFFVEGSGAFYLRAGGHVHQVICEADDLISVPAGTRHWFDMGPDPFFCAIRLFTDPAGWVAEYTGDDIAGRFPTLDRAA
ncbi:MAG: cupin domain-containing protein [Proteobacteria bacterium]|nr:cupin domain-containing protein [Pseudomonadota bacterium]